MTRGVTVPQPAAVEEEPMPWPPKRDMAPSRTHRESPGTIPRDPDTQPTPTADAPSRPSKSQRKRDAHALQALGAQLVALSPAHLAQLALPAALCAVVRNVGYNTTGNKGPTAMPTAAVGQNSLVSSTLP